MTNDGISEYWTGQDIEADVIQSEGLLEHLATGTADNHEQPVRIQNVVLRATAKCNLAHGYRRFDYDRILTRHEKTA
jgi:hypothetical protein